MYVVIFKQLTMENIIDLSTVTVKNTQYNKQVCRKAKYIKNTHNNDTIRGTFVVNEGFLRGTQ